MRVVLDVEVSSQVDRETGKHKEKEHDHKGAKLSIGGPQVSVRKWFLDLFTKVVRFQSWVKRNKLIQVFLFQIP